GGAVDVVRHAGVAGLRLCAPARLLRPSDVLSRDRGESDRERDDARPSHWTPDHAASAVARHLGPVRHLRLHLSLSLSRLEYSTFAGHHPAILAYEHRRVAG